MQTLQDIDIPKEFKKKKKIFLYKAFLLTDGDEMRIHTDIDILSLTPEHAVKYMLMSLNVDELPLLKGRTISLVVFEFLTSDLCTHNLVDAGEVYCQDQSISITIKDKIYKMRVEDRLLEDFEFEINPKNEIKDIKLLTLTDLDKNTKTTLS